MLSLPSSVWIIGLTALVTLILATAIRRAFVRWTGGRRRKRGLRAESQAERLLRKAGYTIHSHRPKMQSHVLIDGKPHTTTLYGDLLATRGSKTFLVEVKSGQYASATRETTRRQRLEYWLNTDCDGILLIDSRSGDVNRIEFNYDVSTPATD